LFRNPLADPYLLGVAAGAGLGAISVAALQAAQPLPVTLPMGAFVGALAAVAIVYGLARTGHSVSTTTLILAGVAVGAFATELMTLILLRSGEATRHVLSFLLGGYGGAGWEAVGVAAPLILAGYGVLYLYARPLNLLLLDEEQARHLGIDVAHARLVIVGAATLTTAAAVAFSGLIGFVGLLVPHAARFCVGPDHRRLLPLTALAGAGFLMLADLLARTIIAPEELPLGAVTAFAGAPFFLLLLRRARGGAYF
jgi:iron complex transport system permease protein